TFFAAERYHQDYYRNNRLQGYCRMIIEPKLAKLRKEFGEKLREPGGG
ncbi:MAG: peptide-methionine (S)-S-oxide reductase, partial [Geobacter sp.]|nr:peptide-methionine (S)-S-oxide reductase [Geobacter sp.]